MQRALALPGLWRGRLPSLPRRVPLCTVRLTQEEPQPGKPPGFHFLGEIFEGFLSVLVEIWRLIGA